MKHAYLRRAGDGKSCPTIYSSSAGRLRSASHLRLCSSTTLLKSAATRLRKRPEAARLTLSHSQMGSSCSRPCTSPDRRATHGVGPYGSHVGCCGFVSLTERKSVIDWLCCAIPALESIVPLSQVCPVLLFVCVCVCDVVRDTVESTPAVCTHGRLSTAHARSCSDVNLFFFFFFWINLYSGVTDPRSRPVVIQSELPQLRESSYVRAPRKVRKQERRLI